MDLKKSLSTLGDKASARLSGTRQRASHAPSVVGSTLGDAATRARSKRLPKGGLREKNLTVEPQDTTRLSTGAQKRRGSVVKTIVIVVVVALVLTVVGIVGVTLLSHTSAFTIETLDAQASEHVSSDAIERLAKIEDGTTLLNIDTQTVEDNLKRNPWVSSATITREFPNTLKIEIQERSVGALVVMSSGDIGWYLGQDNVWIEPVPIEVPDGASINDVALTMVADTGALLITDVPSSVDPSAGSGTTDESILTAEQFQEQFSQSFKSQVASYSVEDTESITCVLTNGVEVSLGSASNVDTKETIIEQLLATYPGQITYINVRVTSRPAFRRISSESVQEGSGSAGQALEDGSSFSDSITSDTIGDPADQSDDQKSTSSAG